MAKKNSLQKKYIYNRKRYWYHLSINLKNTEERLVPWDEKYGINRSSAEPAGKRICVSPTIEQCIAAIPYTLTQRFNIYRTKYPCKAIRPSGIFDSNITQEGWLETPTDFVMMGRIDFEDIEKKRRGYHVIPEAGSGNSPSYSGRVLRWWKKINVKRFIKKP